MESEPTIAVSGYSARLDRKREAIRHDILTSYRHSDGVIGVIRWHLHSAPNDLLNRHHVEELIDSIAAEVEESTKSTIRNAVRTADEATLASSKSIPEFPVASSVDVVLNAKNLTPHSGLVREATWHFKDQCWNFYIEEDGKRM